MIWNNNSHLIFQIVSYPILVLELVLQFDILVLSIDQHTLVKLTRRDHLDMYIQIEHLKWNFSEE
jgi:hypothetical protein